MFLTEKTMEKAGVGKVSKKIPVFVSVVMWIAMAAMYTIDASPVFYRLYNGSSDWVFPLSAP